MKNLKFRTIQITTLFALLAVAWTFQNFSENEYFTFDESVMKFNDDDLRSLDGGYIYSLMKNNPYSSLNPLLSVRVSRNVRMNSDLSLPR